MKRIFEILLATFIILFIIYSLLYVSFFDSICNIYSWVDEKDFKEAVNKLALCKDSLVCYPSDITVNELNEVDNWNCTKKDSPVYWADLYIDIFNHFKNSITK